MKVCSNEWRKLDRRARNEYFKKLRIEHEKGNKGK